MTDVVIVDAIRTPIGALGGILAPVRPDDMAALVIREIIQRNRLDPALVEEVFFGCANQAGEDNRNVARMAALLAGLPVQVAGVTVNRLCASGLSAINQAARAIKAGEGEVYIAGGVESMSRAPYSIPKAEAGFSFGNLTAWDTTLGWRYPNPKMKENTEQIRWARQPKTSRRNVRISRARSRMNSLCIHTSAPSPQLTLGDSKRRSFLFPYHRKKAIQRSWIPTNVRAAILRWSHSPNSNRRLQKDGGTVTAGNSSGLNDGAAALLLMSEEKAKESNHKPLARIIASASAGVPPRVMGYGPVPATRKHYSAQVCK
jgi:acetyl-CoA acetyltransferase